jgi:hypothetical protein
MAHLNGGRADQTLAELGTLTRGGAASRWDPLPLLRAATRRRVAGVAVDMAYSGISKHTGLWSEPLTPVYGS